MRHFIFFVLIFLASTATATPIFPELVAGQYTSRVQAAEVSVDGAGVPLTQPTVSIALILDDGTHVACVSIGPGASASVLYLVPNTGTRTSLNAYAYPRPECVDTDPSVRSIPSENTAFFFFGPVDRPDLLP